MAQRDPFRNFKFEVEIAGFVRAGFSKVTGLKQTTEVIDYREGGDNATPRKLPGQTMFEPVTLERGKSSDEDFLSWVQQVFDLTRAADAQNDTDSIRRTVTVYLRDKAGTRVTKWTLYEAWPSEYSTGDLDAGANDVLLDTIVLQNEGILEERL